MGRYDIRVGSLEETLRPALQEDRLLRTGSWDDVPLIELVQVDRVPITRYVTTAWTPANIVRMQAQLARGDYGTPQLRGTFDRPTRQAMNQFLAEAKANHFHLYGTGYHGADPSCFAMRTQVFQPVSLNGNSLPNVEWADFVDDWYRGMNHLPPFSAT